IGVKVLGSNGSGTFGQILSGILWAADNGADVANMSLGGGFAKAGSGRFVGLINKTFNYAKQKGMLIVVAAGNSSQDLQHNGNFNSDYCDAPHVICVSAVGLATPNGNPDTPSFFTNYGESVVSVAAPGGNASFDAKGKILVQRWIWGNDIASWVWSLCARRTIGGWKVIDAKDPSKDVPGLTICSTANFLNGYIGTSQASPHVTGLAASLIAKYGKGQPQTIKHMIEQTTVPLDPSYGKIFGSGRISVTNALGI
ncbi:MAG TPA: S8 family serine peptidase, partial [Gemmatimonadaceae bacterium]